MRTLYNAQHSFEALATGMHVSLLDVETTTYQPLGRISGFGTNDGGPVVLVTLDTPAYVEGRETFVSVLVVHPSNLARTVTR